MLDRTPLVRGVHKGLKQVFETIFSQSGSQFRKVGLVQFPVARQLVDRLHLFGPGRDHRRALPEKKPMISAFMPCTPNPTTGYFFYIPADQVDRIADFRRRGGETDHVGGPHPAARPGGARRNGGSGEAREAADGDAGSERRGHEQAGVA